MNRAFYADHNFFELLYASKTLDKIVDALVDRGFASRAEINETLERYGPDEIMKHYVYNVFDELEQIVLNSRPPKEGS